MMETMERLTVERLSSGLRICARDEGVSTDECQWCYLWKYRDKDGMMSTGLQCRQHLLLDAVDALNRLDATQQPVAVTQNREPTPLTIRQQALNNFRDDVHQNAVAHGWWKNAPSFPEVIALCHSELSEALEEYRADRPMHYMECCLKGKATGDTCADSMDCSHRPAHSPCPHAKPEGVAVELIDCILRILDYCGHEGVDVEALLLEKHEYNKTRPYRHGGKVI